MTRSVAITGPIARVLDLHAGAESRRTLLGGPPQTAGLRAGMVVLPAGGSVGRHETGAREEVILVLDGQGEVRLDVGAPLAIGPGTGAYVPPATAHDVMNLGEAPLRYVYVVAPVRDPEEAR